MGVGGSGLTTALVLSGGGSLAAVQVGMLKALAAREIHPSLFIGSSVGAVNAAFVAGRGFRGQTLDELAQLWRSLGRHDVSPFAPHRDLLTLTGTRPSLSGPGGLVRLLSSHLGYARLEDAALPIHVVVNDLRAGREVLLSRGDAAAALLASASTPSVLTSPHISEAVALGAERVVVLTASVACSLATPARCGLARAVHSCTLHLEQQAMQEAAARKHDVELIVLPPLCPLAVPSTDFRHADELIERGERATLRWLDAGGDRRPHPERHLALHAHPCARGAPSARHGGRAA
jgi:NTE family protein